MFGCFYKWSHRKYNLNVIKHFVTTKRHLQKRVYLHVCMHMTRSIVLLSVHIQWWRIDSILCVCVHNHFSTHSDWHSWWDKVKKKSSGDGNDGNNSAPYSHMYNMPACVHHVFFISFDSWHMVSFERNSISSFGCCCFLFLFLLCIQFLLFVQIIFIGYKKHDSRWPLIAEGTFTSG